MPRPLKLLDPYASWPALFGAAVQQLRLRLRARPVVSQEELGKRIGFVGSTVSAIERAVLRPDEKFVEGCERELAAEGMLRAMLPLVAAEWEDCERLGITPPRAVDQPSIPSAARGHVAEDATSPGLRLITSHHGLLAEMREVVRGAEHYLAMTGSRSRDEPYLNEIERVLADKPELVHYRLLFGPPRHQVFKEHLLRLLALRGPAYGVSGGTGLHIGIVDDVPREPERFICASEQRAVLAIPSLATAGNFDSGVAFFGPQVAQGFVQHVKQVYAGARRLEIVDLMQELPIQEDQAALGGRFVP